METHLTPGRQKLHPSLGPRRYLKVEMPERFLLQVLTDRGTWMDEAICLRRRFERNPDGSYLCSEFSSGLWIRCVEQHHDHFVHVDGTGARHRYRLLPLPLED